MTDLALTSCRCHGLSFLKYSYKIQSNEITPRIGQINMWQLGGKLTQAAVLKIVV